MYRLEGVEKEYDGEKFVEITVDNWTGERPAYGNDDIVDPYRAVGVRVHSRDGESLRYGRVTHSFWTSAHPPVGIPRVLAKIEYDVAKKSEAEIIDAVCAALVRAAGIKWYFDEDNDLRGATPSGRCVCPITAYVYYTLGQYYDPKDVGGALEVLYDRRPEYRRYYLFDAVIDVADGGTAHLRYDGAPDEALHEAPKREIHAELWGKLEAACAPVARKEL